MPNHKHNNAQVVPYSLSELVIIYQKLNGISGQPVCKEGRTRIKDKKPCYVETKKVCENLFQDSEGLSPNPFRPDDSPVWVLDTFSLTKRFKVSSQSP